jgi:peptide-methionine (S)-S-oxide reductase
MHGVKRTMVGYMGGKTSSPTYRAMGDHSEAIRIDFDPDAVSYETLLESFWGQHTPTHPGFSRQYRSAVFTCGAEQEHAARAVKVRLEAQRNVTLHTALEPAGSFYPAEDYHQKYSLQKRTGVLNILLAFFKDRNDLFASTTAARLNAYLGGNCQAEAVLMAAEVEGLPPRQVEALKHALGWNEVVESTSQLTDTG